MKKKRKNQPKRATKGKHGIGQTILTVLLKQGIGGLCLRLNAILEKSVTVAFIGDIVNKILTRIIRL